VTKRPVPFVTCQFSGGYNNGAFTVGLAVPPPSTGPIRHDVVMDTQISLYK